MAKQILGFTIDVVGTSENKQKIGELTQEIQKLADIKAKLDAKIKDGEPLSKNQELQYGKTTAAIKFLSSEKNKLITTQTNELKSINAVDKSYNSLVAQNAKLSQQLRALADPLGKDKKEFDKLAGSIKNNTDTLKDMDEAMGRSFRNVGDYAGGILKASNEMGLFGNAGAKVQQAMKSMQDGVKTLGLSFKTFGSGVKSALVATGIGAFVLVFASLLEFFTKTKKGAELLERATAALGATFQVITRHLAEIGKNIVEAFDNPKQGIIDLGNAIKENVINRFLAFGVLWDAIKNRDFQKLTDAVIQLGTGMTDASKKGKELLNEIKEEIKATDAITVSNQKLRDAERALNLERAKSLSKIKELEAIGKDTDKTLDERIAATQKAYDIEQGIMKKDVELAQQKLNNLKKEGQLKGELLEDAEHLDKVNQAEIDLYAKKEQSLGRQIQLNSDLNSLQKEKETKLQEFRANEAAYDKFIADEKLAAREKELKDDAEFYEKLSKQNKDQAEKDNQDALDNAKEIADDKKDLEQQIVQASIDAFNDIAKSALQIEKNRLDDTYNRNITALDKQKKAGLISETNYEKQKIKLDKEAFERKKKLALKEIAINTAVGILNVIATSKDPYTAAVAVVATIVAGVTQAAVVNSQKFARGGMVHGSGSGTSDSINARLSNGEFVMNAKSTAAFAPMLNAMNVAGGGRNSFAQGGIVSPISASGISGSIVSAQSQMNFDMLALRIVSGVNDKKVYLKEADVTTSQKTVSTILASSKF